MDTRAVKFRRDSSSDSPYEGLQENDTEDSFGRRMIREMRAEKPGQQAFRRPRPRPRHGLTPENLERVPLVKENVPPEYIHRQAGSVTSSGDSMGSDPPPNVPKSWAVRGRKPEWLKRRFAAEVQAFSEALKSGSNEPIDWSAIAVDAPIPSVEDTPLSHKSSKRSTPVANGTLKSTKLDEIMRLEQEEEDFFKDDVITSTPAIISRNTKLDEIRRLEREIAVSDVVEDESYPTPPPDRERRRRTSSPKDEQEQSRNRSRNRDLAMSWSHPAEQELNIQKPDERSPTSSQLRDANPLPETTSHTDAINNLSISPDAHTNVQRSEHRREDSQDILRRLARAASGTPSPSRIGTAITAFSPKKRKQARFTDGSEDGAARTMVGGPVNASPSKQRNLGTEPDQAKSLTVPTVSPEGQREDMLADVTALDNATTNTFEPKTPVVTGAWVDTPKPATTTRLLETAPPASYLAANDSSKRDTEPQRTSTAAAEATVTTKPLLPSSALTAVLSSKENGLGDSTITSLEDLLGRSSGNLNLDEDTLTSLDLSLLNPKTPAEQLRYRELKTLRKMNEQLRATRESIRDAKLGIGRVERAVYANDGAGAAGGVVGAGAEVLSFQQCKHCGHALPCSPTISAKPLTALPPSTSLVSSHGQPSLEHANAPVLAIFISLKGILWYTPPPGTTTSGTWKLTWLALAAVLFWTWLLSESVACMIWCRPVYSAYDGRLRPDAPEFPFVIPTVLLRPVWWLLGPVVMALWRDVGPGVSAMWDFVTFVWEDEALKEEWKAAAAKTGRKVLSSATRAWLAVPTGDVGSMDDDEFL